MGDMNEAGGREPVVEGSERMLGGSSAARLKGEVAREKTVGIGGIDWSGEPANPGANGRSEEHGVGGSELVQDKPQLKIRSKQTLDHPIGQSLHRLYHCGNLRGLQCHRHRAPLPRRCKEPSSFSPNFQRNIAEPVLRPKSRTRVS